MALRENGEPYTRTIRNAAGIVSLTYGFDRGFVLVALRLHSGGSAVVGRMSAYVN